MKSIATLTAVEIARLAFDEFINTESGESAKTSLGGAIDLVKNLRDKIRAKFQGSGQAETALTEVEQQKNEAALKEVTEYLNVAMMKDKDFATQVRQIAQQIINAQNQSEKTNQGFHDKLIAATSVISAIAAIAAAYAAHSLNSLEGSQRDFLKKQNASQAIQQWQINTAQIAPSGFKCQVFLNKLTTGLPDTFDNAWDKKAYNLEGQERQEALKACLDRENRTSLPALEEALNANPYVTKSIPVSADVSRFVTTQALDYLNITEAVYMQWKYEIAERCIIEEQLGIQTSNNMRGVVGARTESFRGLHSFFEKNRDTDAVLASIQECKKNKKI